MRYEFSVVNLGIMEYKLNEYNILELLTEYPATYFSIGSGGYFHHTQINTENFTLFQNQIFSGEKTIHLDGESSVPSLEIQINIGENDIPFYINPSQRKIAKKLHCNLLYINGEKSGISFQSQQEYKTFDVHMPLHRIFEYYGNNAIIDNFIKQIENQEPAMLFDEYLPVSHTVYELIRGIKQCNLPDFLKKEYLNIKVQEIFLSILSESERSFDPNSISLKDQKLLLQVKNLMEQNIEKPLTIIELSRLVGMNDNKLKILFKRYFGCTLFEYFQQYRMHKAKMYLEQKELTIKEIAYQLGYSNTANFSNAFKRFWGISPSEK
ncbi:helix-turn-helix domain-containing protein [Capnocytophaga canis]|uniref:helix-turn-helix domain-containing protein n=1 Tax=Capnocytophaga canis TaxID=1848903 RepID=UPI00385830F5